MTKEILEQIVSELFQSNFTVVAISYDMGTGNMALWTKLNVGDDKNCSFFYPCDSSLQIFIFADIPQLIKLARNHLFNQGFVLNKDIINIEYIRALLNISTSELTLAHKLTEHHLQLKGSMRQRVRPAVEVFTNSVTKAIKYAGENGLITASGTRQLTWCSSSMTGLTCLILDLSWLQIVNLKMRLEQI